MSASVKADIAASQLKGVRGAVLSFHASPFEVEPQESYDYFEDGLVVVRDGIIEACGPYSEVAGRYPGLTDIDCYPRSLIMPGFIDCHCHYVQSPMIGSYGDTLLKWLNRYTFPTEMRMADPEFARETARVFFRQLLSCGTTTANVFATTYPCSVDALFEESERLGARTICGKVLQDRNVPEGLRDRDAGESVAQAETLLNKWHRRGRQLYAVIPRFAPTSTPEQLRLAGELYRAHEKEGVYMHTHLNEAENEIEWALSLFPGAHDYTDIYERYGLVGERSVFAHCCLMEPDEWKRLSRAGSGVAHCPASNLFLGDGQFKIDEAIDPAHPCRVGIGTDVGGGTTFSILRQLGEAYKVAMLRQVAVSALKWFYLATLGGARALRLDHLIGSLTPGHEADMVVLDMHATPFLDWRLRNATCAPSLEERLFLLQTLAPSRAVAATYLAGRLAWSGDSGAGDRP